MHVGSEAEVRRRVNRNHERGHRGQRASPTYGSRSEENHRGAAQSVEKQGGQVYRTFIRTNEGAASRGDDLRRADPEGVRDPLSVREPENDEVDIEPESPENERAEKLQKSGAVVVVSLQKTESPDPHPDPAEGEADYQHRMSGREEEGVEAIDAVPPEVERARNKLDQAPGEGHPEADEEVSQLGVRPRPEPDPKESSEQDEEDP